MSAAPRFFQGQAVEFSSYLDKKVGNVVSVGVKQIARGTYIQPLGDIYSDVRVGNKATLVRTDRLRASS